MTQMNGAFKPAEDEIDLADLLSLFWIKKWFILVVTGIVFAIGLSIVDRMPNIYKATTTVMVKGSKANNPLQSLVPGMGSANDDLDTTIKLLKSSQFAQTIVDSLSIPATLNQYASDFTWSGDDLLTHLSINIVSKTNLLEISFESQDAKFSAVVANQIAQAFMQYQTDLMQPHSNKSDDWINSKIQGVKDSLEVEEAKLMAFRQSQNVVDIASNVTIAKQEISLLYRELRELNLQFDLLKRFSQKVSLANNDLNALLVINEITNAPIIRELVQQKASQQAQLSQIKLRYLDKHPTFKSMALKIADTEQQLEKEVQAFIVAMTKNKQEVELQISELELKQQNANDLLESAIIQEQEFKKIQRSVDANIKLLESLSAKQKETELLKDITDSSDIIVVDPAITPISPIRPKKALIAAVSCVMGFILSIVLVILLHFFADAHRRYRQIAHHYGYKVLGELPRIRNKNKDKSQPILLGSGKQFEIYQESIRSIRTKVMLDKELGDQKIIAVTSLTPNEGKSSTCLQMAKSFSELERVIIIDADLRDPSIAVALGESRHRPGLTNFLAQTHTFEECIFHDEQINADVLPSGLRPMNPLLFLSMQRFESMLNVLQKKYDRIILECPPILSVSDALMVSKHVSGLTLVVDVQKTSLAKFNHDIELLSHAETTISGVILNRIKYDNQNYYYGSTKKRT
ncbi:GumC family protein [Pseudoalteromonas tunicata]|uniref:GumC family protein n=1 Tax=Pseudoalteromonas tunicata TaxID=314281 RepID=UPI00273EC89C|nr:polysaccharide biosynthesis tyrosine autokinase [Pseudoalteromonas tunicata]MDP4984775.1 polysaccharide biosynthesis tyrosine autokinase [Pseudoalteromonas tunicata]